MPTNTILIDTHVLIWYLTKSPKLSDKALHAIENSVEPVCLSTITLVELVYLIDRRKLVPEFMQRVLQQIDDALFTLVPVDIHVVNALSKIPRNTVPDMPDRIIAATSAALGISVVTCDSKIRSADIQTIW